MRLLDEGKIWVVDIALHRPTLDDVFLSLTGRVAEDGSESGAEPADRRRGKGRKGKEEEHA